jgi:hypothetical protein
MSDISGREGVKMPPDQLPAIVPPGGRMTTTDTYVVPVLIARAGDQAGWRYVEFFTAKALAAGQIDAWYATATEIVLQFEAVGRPGTASVGPAIQVVLWSPREQGQLGGDVRRPKYSLLSTAAFGTALPSARE